MLIVAEEQKHCEILLMKQRRISPAKRDHVWMGALVKDGARH